jgi:hypothetical protein
MSEESTGVAAEKEAVTPDADSLESTTVQTPVDEEVQTPSNDTADTAETVDMNDVLANTSQPIDPNDERGGLSRKQLKRKEDKDSELDDLRSQVEELKNVLSSSADNAQFLQEAREQAERLKIEQSFHDTLSKKGVDAATFNAQYKDAFKEEQQDLLDSGLSLAKATEKALKITLASYQADTKVQDTEKRAEGRAKATIPPSSTTSTLKTVYTEKQLAKLDQADYNKVMELRDKGDVKIVR